MTVFPVAVSAGETVEVYRFASRVGMQVDSDDGPACTYLETATAQGTPHLLVPMSFSLL